MPERFLQKRNCILLCYASALLVLWVLTLLWGTAMNKALLLVLTLIVPLLFYGFVRLLYRILRIHASSKIMCRFFVFFACVSILGTVLTVIDFITDFPNGLSPSLGACGAILVATLDTARKNTSIPKEEDPK